MTVTQASANGRKTSTSVDADGDGVTDQTVETLKAVDGSSQTRDEL